MISVELLDVDEVVLAELVRCALADASANEVTPAITAGDRWTPERTAWLREFHRDRRAGIDGPCGEATWAVAVEGRSVGSVRLQRRSDAVAEIGIWLGRDARGFGSGRLAAELVLVRARAAGLRQVVAETTSGNTGAMTLLRSLGFEVAPAKDRERVVATVELDGGQPEL